MGVKRLLIIITTFLVCAMLIDGLYYKDAPLMWLASTSQHYAYMRASLIVVLLSLLITKPPRSAYFRLFLTGFSLAILISSIVLSYHYAIGLMDAVVFLEVAIIFMIEALETEVEKRVKPSFTYAFAKKK